MHSISHDTPTPLELPLRDLIRERCAALAKRLDVALCAVWSLASNDNLLDLQASGGAARLHAVHERMRVGKYKIGVIATDQLPVLTNAFLDDPAIASREWAVREELTSFAGCPLLIGTRTVGVLAVFGRTDLPQSIIAELTAAAPSLARLIHEHASPFVSTSDSGVHLKLKGDERFLFLGDAIPHQVWTAAPDGQLTYVNQRVLEYFGRSHEQLLGSGWLDTLHPDDVAECTKRWGMSLGSGEPYEFEFRLWSVKASAYRWHEARALPERNNRGEIVQWYGANTDVDARRRSEDRHRLLLEAGRRLSSSLDAPHILAEVASICVPHLADWCFIDLLRLDGTCDRVQVACANPMRQGLAKRFFQWPAALYDPKHPANESLVKGTARFVAVLTDEQLDDAAMSPEHREAQREMGPSSLMTVPMRAIERNVGIISLLTSVDSGRRFTPEDLDLAQEIGSRAALALENARYISELRAAFAQREQALADAEFERRTLQRIFEQAPAAICITRGPKHVIETANRRFTDIVGPRDLPGKTFAQAFPEVMGQADLGCQMDEAFKNGVAYVGTEVPFELARETEVKTATAIFDFVYQPLSDDTGAVQGIMIFAVEVTEQVTARREREAMIATLAQANAELDEFASVASHDLKAPLRGIANLSEWLSESLAPKATEEERVQLSLIQNRAKRLGALVDGILIYARAGRLRGTKEKVDTRALVTEILELLGATHEPVIEVSARMPTLMIERVLIQQILMNLIGNAIKYTRRTDARIAIDCETTAEGWVFSVKDNGPGIASEHHAKIWEPFQRLQGRDVVEGTGIGLSVVRKIVESRGGTVSVVSAPGEGATFMVRWPKTA